MTNSLTQVTLANGLKVLLKEIHTAPIISPWLWYRVGSKDEVPGRTGISHWVEHMQFKGTPKFPANILDGAANVPTKVTPWAEKFNDAWVKRWGKEPSGYTCSAPYMSLYVLKDAIERANSLDSEALISSLEKTDIKGGVYGRIRFDPKNHDVIRSLDPEEGALGTWFQWQDGKRISIFPPAVATGSLRLPPWFKR